MTDPRRLSLRHVVFFGTGNTGLSIVNIVLQTWLLYFLAPGVGRVLIPASYVGAVWFFGRVVDAAADPLIANWSDRLTSRHGRRMPFLMYSTVPLALVMFLLFWEPVYAGPLAVRVLILAVLLGSFYFLFTAWAAPYYGFIPDFSDDRADRLNMATSSAVFNLVGTAIAMIAAGKLIDAFSEKPGVFDPGAFTPSMGILAFITALSFALCIAGIFSLRNRGGAPAGENLWRTMGMVFQNKPYVVYLFAMNIFWGGFVIINVSVPYYVTVLMGQPVGFTAAALGATMGVAVLAFPFINYFAKRFGNRYTVIGCSGLMGLLLFMIPFIGAPFTGLSPTAMGMVIMVIAGIPIAGLFLIPNAMVADLSDFRLPDGRKPGEVIYFGVQGLLQKFIIGVVTAMAGVLFDVFGSSPERPLGIQLTGYIGGVLAFFSVYMFVRHYPDDRKGLF
ncbi:MAG TPA: hypothetical protein ENN21_03970 [Spirochaetes bacterium]|nr:hypothetical protein [Spirochaetota bacterium]